MGGGRQINELVLGLLLLLLGLLLLLVRIWSSPCRPQLEGSRVVSSSSSIRETQAYLVARLRGKSQRVILADFTAHTLLTRGATARERPASRANAALNLPGSAILHAFFGQREGVQLRLGCLRKICRECSG